MEFYKGYTPEQCVSITTFLQALLMLLWRAPMIGYFFFVENRTFLLCIDTLKITLVDQIKFHKDIHTR